MYFSFHNMLGYLWVENEWKGVMRKHYFTVQLPSSCQILPALISHSIVMETSTDVILYTPHTHKYLPISYSLPLFLAIDKVSSWLGWLITGFILSLLRMFSSLYYNSIQLLYFLLYNGSRENTLIMVVVVVFSLMFDYIDCCNHLSMRPPIRSGIIIRTRKSWVSHLSCGISWFLSHEIQFSLCSRRFQV